MTPNETAAIRQMLIDVVGAHTAEIDGKFELIKQELGHIKEQTTKTNGRVNKHDQLIIDLEKKNIEHFVSCPMRDRVETLEDSEKSKKSVYRFVSIVAGVFASLAVIVIAFFELIKK